MAVLPPPAFVSRALTQVPGRGSVGVNSLLSGNTETAVEAAPGALCTVLPHTGALTWVCWLCWEGTCVAFSQNHPSGRRKSWGVIAM